MSRTNDPARQAAAARTQTSTPPRKKVLIVDDEKDIVDLVAYNLARNGYETITATDGNVALDSAAKNAPDLIILDLMLPGLDGMEVARRLKADTQTANIPIVMLTAKGEETDVVVGLTLGADDYVTKPFGTRELRARIKALLRRASGEPAAATYRFGEVEVDFERGELRRNGQALELTPIEFKLLALFVRERGRVMSRDRLLAGAWGPDTYASDRIVDNHIANLRRKIEPDPANPIYLRNLRGLGYRFDG